MPGNGLHACEVMASDRPELSIVMLTISEDMIDVLVGLSRWGVRLLAKGRGPSTVSRRLFAERSPARLIVAGVLLKSLDHGTRSTRRPTTPAECN